MLKNSNISNSLKFFKFSKNSSLYKNFSWYKKTNQNPDNEVAEVEVNVKIKEDVFDKRDIIDREFNKYDTNQYFAHFTDESIQSATLEQLILILKSMVKNKNTNFDTWYKAINKFNDYLCNHQASKADVIEFLEVLNFFQPKILEKKTVAKEFTQIGSEVAFSSKHEEEYNKLMAPKDVLLQFALFLKKNFKPRLLLEVVKESYNDSTKKFENRENIDEGLDDLLGMYDVLFRNIEMKTIDDIKNGRASYTYQDCLRLIACFSRASEGTNLLYEVLMRKISKHADKLEMPEIEIIINYLPHDLYNNKEIQKDDFKYMEKETNEKKQDEEKYPETGRTPEISQFYKIILEKISNNVTNLNDEKFINFFQGILKIKFVDVDTISSFLNSFDLRVNKNEKDKKFFFDFLQLMAYFLKQEENKKFLSNFDMELLFKSIQDPFIKKYMGSFDLKEIATIFWVCYHLGIINVEKIKIFENTIKNILTGYINDPKSKIDSMGYESHIRYYNNYGIEPYDLESLNFFIRTEKNYKGELLNLMAKALKCIEVENTHPLSRKWFHF
jgi:hypothetical protein